MPNVDIDSLLTEVTTDEPCGPNLEYDPAFLELEQAVAGKGEVQYGDVITPAVGPEWKVVARLSTKLLERSRDLRIIVPMLRASLALDGFAGMAPCLALIERLLGERWDSVHPQLDADDGDDPTLRINSLAILSDTATVLREVKEATLIVLPGLGPISVKDLEAPGGENGSPEAEPRIALSSIKAALLDVAPDTLQRTIDALATACERTRDIETLLVRRVGSSQALNLDPLTKLFARGLEVVKSAAPDAQSADIDLEADVEASSGAGPGNAASPNGAISGAVNSRADVSRVLDLVIAYYLRCEPSSPVPMVLERAQRLVNMNFMELLKDLAPEGVSQFTVFSGSKSE